MEWFEDDRFWIEFAPVMFNADRWQDTPWEVDSLIALTAPPAGAAILDSCCGVGRHSLEFARRGFTVTAVDRTAAYIEAARESAAAEELAIEFVTADVRNFSRPEGFDLALNIFTSFGFFSTPSEELQYISHIRDSLVPGGAFVIDVNGKELVARDFTAVEEYELDGCRVRGEYGIAENFSVLSNRWSVRRDGGEYSYEFSHRLYSAVELRELLLRGGFSRVDVFGGFDGRPYDNEALRLITVARR